MRLLRRNAKHFGYVRSRAAVRDFVATRYQPFLADQNGSIRGSGKGKQVRLVQAFEQIGGEFENHVQEIGDCVSHGFTLGGDTVCAVEIANGEREQWKGKHSTEFVYGISRVEVGGGKIRGDGSTGAWGAKAVTTYGLLLRRNYGDYDLSRYRPDLAKRWGDRGVPDELEIPAKDHTIKTATLVQTAEEARDAIANGYPVAVCSDQGFASRTDAEGFLAPRGTWYHCMLIWGVDDLSDRKGFEIVNSWPESWVRGPKHKLGTAPSGFWADYRTVDRMLRQGDSYALSGFQGYPARKLDYILL